MVNFGKKELTCFSNGSGSPATFDKFTGILSKAHLRKRKEKTEAENELLSVLDAFARDHPSLSHALLLHEMEERVILSMTAAKGEQAKIYREAFKKQFSFRYFEAAKSDLKKSILMQIWHNYEIKKMKMPRMLQRNSSSLF